MSGDLPPLAVAADLVGLDGSPFPDKAVEAAAAQIRALCGWHIAPKVTETLVLDSDGGSVLWLPTRRIEDVSAVRINGRDVSGWSWSASGALAYPGGFPSGFRAVEVDLVHGFDECPADLLPVVADRTRRRVMQESLGSRAVTFGVEGDRTIDQTLSLYRLGPRP